MEKTIVCSIPMRGDVAPVVYASDDPTLPSSDRRVRYPVNAFLEKTLSREDRVKVVAVIQTSPYSHAQENLEYFRQELSEINAGIGAQIEVVVIDTAFEEKKAVHEQLMGRLVDSYKEGTHLIVDTTYGSKDIPIVIFESLRFAEKFLDCQVDQILYGQASFDQHNQVRDPKLCDMSALFYLGAVTDLIHASDPKRAREMLKSLLFL